MPRKPKRRKPKRKVTKKATIEQLVNKIVKNSKELREKGFSKEEILYLVAFSVGGLALVTGLGLGGVALSRKMRKKNRKSLEEIQAEHEKSERDYYKNIPKPDNFNASIDSKISTPGKINKGVYNRANQAILSRLRLKNKKEAEIKSLYPDGLRRRNSPFHPNTQSGFRVGWFGKKKKRKKVSKKPSATLRRLCKKYKVRLTVKRGKKRVYKSEKVLKKQCKTAMKRKK